MTRHTSKLAYDTIKQNGLLGKLQWEVYECIFNNGPLTAGETWSKYFPHYQRHSIQPRFAELAEKELIASVGERTCGYTGRQALVWDVTENLPKEIPTKETSKQKITRLEKENLKLREQNQNLFQFCCELEDQLIEQSK